MQITELRQLIDGTSDAAFAVARSGKVVAWNAAASALFGVPAEKALGNTCTELLQGSDECGEVCCQDCGVQLAVQDRRPVRSFDLQVRTPAGPRWCNVSVLIAEMTGSDWPCSIHIVRPNDLPKRMEILVRNFVSRETGLPDPQVREFLSGSRSSFSDFGLTRRELEVLRLLSRGLATPAISARLSISPSTVNNHVQHLMQKLNAHSRLEAVRRAEHAGLI